MQRMMARSPLLIERLAAEHEVYMGSLQKLHDHSHQTHTKVSSYTQDHFYEPNSCEGDGEHFEQKRASKALAVISHYLEKYDKGSAKTSK